MKSRTYLDTGAGDKRSPAAAYRNVLFIYARTRSSGWEGTEGTGRPDRFRTIQIYPKDVPAIPRQAEGAQNRAHRPLSPAGSPVGLTQSERRRTDVRHEAVRVHPAPWRAAVYPPLAARVQKPERVGRIVFLHALAENEPEAQAPAVAFRQGLEALPPSCAVTGDNLPRAAL